jgi:hypothetical protein
MIKYGTACGEDFTGNTLNYVQTGKPEKIKSQAFLLEQNETTPNFKIHCLVRASMHVVPYNNL